MTQTDVGRILGGPGHLLTRAKGGGGYLLVDNRASGGAFAEAETMTCGHCNCVVVLNPLRARDRGHCKRCNHYVCDKPGCRADCNPIAEMIDLALSSPTGGGQGFIGRDPLGGIQFDPRVRDRRRVH